MAGTRQRGRRRWRW